MTSIMLAPSAAELAPLAMARLPLRVLLVEDNPDDAKLLVFELDAGGYEATVERVWTEEAYREKLETNPDVILADYTLPRFGALPALRILRDLAVDIPLIVVTGTIGEDKAVECIHLGAADYLLKDRLARLCPAVARALQDKEARDAKRAAEEALRERLRFEELLTALSTRLINARPSELDEALLQVLRAVAEFHDADQVVARTFEPTRRELVVTQYWRSPSAKVKEPATNVQVDGFSWYVQRVLEGHGVLLIRDELPADEENTRQRLDQLSVAVQALMPLKVEGELIGMIGLQWHRRPARLPADLLTRLNLLADIVANTFGRKRAEDQREQTFQELERLKRAAEQERDYLREELRDTGSQNIIGESGALRRVLEMVDAVATTRATVLIRGESGVGKEVIARAIHERSGRANGPLVKVNCASIPKELFESEFFGHVKGSFTGALRNRAGRFELAEGGTIFLDEVGEIPMDMQSKLLRVLQESEFERVGGIKTIRIDVRLVAATNSDLKREIAAGAFREDLYYRLNVVPIRLPPLRERREDIA
ncbi:MAG TPA: sigma 54-interacting transcriptional regulator, partial [Polyangiaceae bacterium]|nr:sigma 54-interacting transcriptional regulator [Polyangiaceae bacterium]